MLSCLINCRFFIIIIIIIIIMTDIRPPRSPRIQTWIRLDVIAQLLYARADARLAKYADGFGRRAHEAIHGINDAGRQRQQSIGVATERRSEHDATPTARNAADCSVAAVKIGSGQRPATSHSTQT